MTSIVATFFTADAKRKLERASRKTCEKVAYQAEGYAKVDAPVDTGFYANSIYVITEHGSNYDQTWSTGTYISRATGQLADREIEPENTLPSEYDAALAAGASYAIWIELEHDILYKAVHDAVHDVPGAVNQVAIEDGLL